LSAAAITSISVSRFRGISETVRLELIDLEGKPCSVVIVGDNGTGKSSIVDAFELILQGRLHKSKRFQSSVVPCALSVMDSSGAKIEISFSDGSSLSKSITSTDLEMEKNYEGGLSQYLLNPLILRRSDINKFWDTPARQKIMLFFDYFKSAKETPSAELPNLKAEDLYEKRMKLKIERRKVVEELAQSLRVNVAAIPTSREKIHTWVKMQIQNGDTRTLASAEECMKEAAIIYDFTEKISNIKRELVALRKLKNPETVQETKDGLRRVSQNLTTAFKRISPGSNFVDKIELYIGDLSAVSLNVGVFLSHNNICVSPKRIFSEANLDLLALLLFVSIAQEAASQGQAKLLILDDVLQSVDAGIRVGFMEYILSEMSDWQLVVTVHDRLWQEQLRFLMNRRNHKFVERQIVKWSLESGPVLIKRDGQLDAGLRNALALGEAYQICSESGILLERLCDVLSLNLPVSVTRKQGDRYTIGDLWPGICKTLRKTNLAQVGEDVDLWLHLRNILGAHYNEWSRSLSREEAVNFGQSILALLAMTFCNSCHRWIEATKLPNGTTTGWVCRCGSKSIAPTKNAKL
jgi:hypothetical protein